MDYINNNIHAEDLFKKYQHLGNKINNNEYTYFDEVDKKTYGVIKVPFNYYLIDKLRYYGYRLGQDFTITMD